MFRNRNGAGNQYTPIGYPPAGRSSHWISSDLRPNSRPVLVAAFPLFVPQH